jgi:hypothetical protein
MTNRLILAGAATISALAIFGAVPAHAETAIAPGSAHAPASVGARVVAVDDDSGGAPGDTGGGVNDQGQTSGDIFTQNAQDQSTA